MGWLVSGLLAFLLSLALTPAVLAALRRWHVLDHPTARSSHDHPVVRGGGLACAVAAASAWFAAGLEATAGGLGILVAAAALGTIGLAEDILGIPALPRFALQVGASALACIWVLNNLQGPLLWRVVFGGGAVVWLVAYTNGFNFMDGINGISSFQSIIAGSVWAWLGYSQGIDELLWAGQILAGAALGFLPFNFPSARIFLGDVGSYFIGGWQAAILVVGFREGVPPEAMLAPLLIYLADTSVTLLRRILAGERWQEPHREHAYQRLVRQGWSHPRTTGVVCAYVAACSVLGFLALAGLPARALGSLALAGVLASYLALPAWMARRRIRTAGRA